MHRLLNLVIAVLGFVVFCGSHPYGIKEGLEMNKKDKEPALMLLVTKDRTKRSTNQQAALTAEEQKQKNDHEMFIQTLKNDSGFLANLKLVFADVSVKNTTYVYKTNDSVPADGSTNSNNTGLDDRLQSKEFLRRRYRQFVTTGKTTTTSTSDYEEEDLAQLESSYNVNSDTGRAIMEIFGTPSSKTAENEPQASRFYGNAIDDTTTGSTLITSENEKSSSNSQNSIIYINIIFPMILFVILIL